MRHRIFVPLATDPEALREVEAIADGGGRFRIAGSASQTGPLQFKRGEIVECEIRTLANGSKGLVAFRSMSADPEFRSRRIIFGVSGAIVGGIFGAALDLWVVKSGAVAAAGFVIGAVLFSFSSVRWGDPAWTTLSRALRWM
jgi:hypothetical protein